MTENSKIFVTELTVNNSLSRKLRNSSIMKTSKEGYIVTRDSYMIFKFQYL